MIEISQVGVLLLFYHSFLCGVLLSAVNDSARALGYLLFHDEKEKIGVAKKLVSILEWTYTALIDVLITVSGAVMMIIIAYSENSGILRWTIPVGAVVGIVFYKLTAGRIVKVVLRVIADAVRKALKVILKAVFRTIFGRIRKYEERKSDGSHKANDDKRIGKSNEKAKKRLVGKA